ncbi:uncharacterized protein LOC123310546 [Coccinella septempunctata]|uniref:uncharacterized protein LOC123310546 n=1 Tax=Coccinella septempunctata TaxID=41139 RepID=UPI001D06DE60|nr:uncharacterized protein LOC123310546 [Coccinella septempunctata]
MNYSIGMTHLCQYALISGVIALVEYQLIVSSNMVTGISQLLILIIGEFMVCSAGQNLEDEREAMAASLYLTPWYKLPPELRSTFTIFLAKMQMPLHFEAKPIIHLNYEFLMKVLKGSYTFLMFLQKKSSQTSTYR